MSVNTISLKGISLFGFHGCLPEEKVIGSNYEIDITLFFDTSLPELTDKIEDTIDYSLIYNIVKDVFDKPVNLLEHLARNILNEVHCKYSKIFNSSISIKKLNPPITGKIKFAEITLWYKNITDNLINNNV